jgi:hypothetical protein
MCRTGRDNENDVFFRENPEVTFVWGGFSLGKMRQVCHHWLDRATIP